MRIAGTFKNADINLRVLAAMIASGMTAALLTLQRNLLRSRALSEQRFAHDAAFWRYADELQRSVGFAA